MTQRSPQAHLWDARHAAQAILRYIDGKSFDDYLSDELLRMATERQLITIGEAVRAAVAIDPPLSVQIPDVSQIIAFRNRLVHGYFVISNETVWHVVRNELTLLVSAINLLLPEDPANPLESP